MRSLGLIKMVSIDFVLKCCYLMGGLGLVDPPGSTMVMSGIDSLLPDLVFFVTVVLVGDCALFRPLPWVWGSQKYLLIF